MSAPHRLIVATVVFAGALVAGGAASSIQTPTLDDLLRRAGEYHAMFAMKVSGVTLEEQYQLINVSQGKMQSPVRLASDVVLVNTNGNVASLRDVFAVDTRPLRERAPRITSLLAVPAPAMSDWETVARLPQQAAVYFMLDIIVKVNEPTTALRFIPFPIQSTMKYKLDGKKKLNGVETIAIGFEEPSGPDKKYALGTRRNGRASGRIWVDPATGAFHQTELWVESKGESANVTVKYAPHPTLKMLLPTQTTETYEEREFGGEVRDFAGAGSSEMTSHHSFQAAAKYGKATYHPINLANLKK